MISQKTLHQRLIRDQDHAQDQDLKNREDPKSPSPPPQAKPSHIVVPPLSNMAHKQLKRMKHIEGELLNPQSQERAKPKERGRPKLYNPP